MKFAVFACLLVIAGVSALPEDVAPAQERVVDIWLQNFIQRIRRWILEREYDPLIIKQHDMNYVLIDGLVELLGEVKDLKLEGLSGIYWNYMNFNLLGRLDVDLIVPRVSLSIGKSEIEGRYGDRGGKGKLSGSLVITNIRLIGNALLRLDPGPQVTIYNINVDSSIENIEADLEVSWQCRTCTEPENLSSSVNKFLNATLPDLLMTFKIEIDTFVAEVIRRLVNRWW